ncbi:hypothetical protein [uncultured Microscilla sp.]|uniref:hypothetical protein n=1 Tax=uncultured Microscilla sp. TaxID=432653 RepID=UPI00262A42DD|nr:hypothetical protein [uncultured Microscilla sp.]
MKKKLKRSSSLFFITLLPFLLWQCTPKREEIVVRSTVAYPKISLRTDYYATSQASAILDITQSGVSTPYSIRFVHSINPDLSLSVEFLADFGTQSFTQGDVLPFRATGLMPNNTHYITALLTLPDTTIQTDTVQFNTLTANALGRFTPINSSQAQFGNNTQLGFAANDKGYLIGGNLSSQSLYLWEYDPQSGEWSIKKENQLSALAGAFFDSKLASTFTLNGQYYVGYPEASKWHFYNINLDTGAITANATIEAEGTRLFVANNQLFVVSISTIAGNDQNKNLNVSEIDLATQKVTNTYTAITNNYDQVALAQMAGDKVHIILTNFANSAQAIHRFEPVAKTLTLATNISGKLPETTVLSTFTANNQIYYFSKKANDNSTHYFSVFNPVTFASTRLTEYAGSTASNIFKLNNIFHIVGNNGKSYMIEADF